jgi:hypothetical protein
MTTLISKSNPAIERACRSPELKPASLSARDPVAVAAALKILG